ncbi:hypothetical protein [Streptomyces sp. NPDC096311]|uniref:hypothetical protein n=1 Tax=Streptomyces sp. NPDC096311 TaxID=3366083 RepID=UPI00380E18F1
MKPTPVSVTSSAFAEPLVKWSTHERFPGHLWLGEAVATAGLVLLVLGLNQAGRTPPAPFAVASRIGAAYWFTFSTSFVNPAVTVGRPFSDTFAGIAPASVAPFVAVQPDGAAVGLVLLTAVFARPAPGSSPSSSTPSASGPGPGLGPDPARWSGPRSTR